METAAHPEANGDGSGVFCSRSFLTCFRTGNGGEHKDGERSDKDEKDKRQPADSAPLGLAASSAQLAEQFEISAAPLDGSGLSPAPKVCVGCKC